ncbi:MAG: hypothetical protein ACQUYJ_06725, partial [Ferruginibacter sp.]
YKQNSSLPLSRKEYTFVPSTSVYGDIIIPELTVTKYPVPLIDFGTAQYVLMSWNWYLFGKTEHISAWNPLVSSKNKLYEQNGSNFTESIENYDYKKFTFNNKEYLYPLSTTNLKDSKNEQTVTTIKYPLDFNTTNGDSYLQGIAQLVSKNVLATPIEQYSYKQDQSGNNKKYIGASLNTYHTDKPLPKSILKLQTNGLVNNFTASSVTNGQFNFDNRYKTELNFPKYDAGGRIEEQNKEWDIKEVYIWNYNKMYPTAKVVNANSSEIAFSSFEADEGNSKLNIVPANIVENPSGALTGKKYYLLSNTITSNIVTIPNKKYKLSFWAKGGDPFIGQYINGMYEFVIIPAPLKSKTGWNYYEVLMPANFTGVASLAKRYAADIVYADEVRLTPVQSQINTYTFDPLIGMTSESDVNSKTTYYEYDAFNRLSVVKNEDKDIVKTICYNYANQVVPCVSSCAAPIINSAIKTGGFNVTLDFTAPANSTNCTIQITSITDPSVIWNEPPGCTSPRTITIPYRLHQYSVIVTSFSAQCPNGTQSLPFTF